MEGKSILASFLAIVAGFILIAGCLQGNSGSSSSSTTGRVIFAISDAAANMGAVTSVKVTVDSVEAHSAADGWTTVSSSAKTYDLLALKARGEQVLLADAQLKEGTYEQVRLHISKVVVTDASGDHDAKLPSSELKIIGNIVVKANTTSAVAFDFIADESLHVTGNGQYIMSPVVRLETRERAEVEVKDDDSVKINGGDVDARMKVGMDVEGNVGEDHILPAKANLTIESDGRVRSHGMEIDIGAGINSG